LPIDTVLADEDDRTTREAATTEKTKPKVHLAVIIFVRTFAADPEVER
jgi:hypothetical protein